MEPRWAVGERVRFAQAGGSSRRALVACCEDGRLELLLDDGREQVVTVDAVSPLLEFELAAAEEQESRSAEDWKEFGNTLFSSAKDYEAAEEYYRRGLRQIEPPISIGQTVAVITHDRADFAEAMVSRQRRTKSRTFGVERI